MSIKFNADEVFQMAERIETLGAEFYTKAADLHEKKSDVEFLRKLAKMEYSHRDTFAEMRRKLSPEMRKLPDDYPYLKATLYLDRMADTLGGEGTLSQANPLQASDSLEDILLKAITLEEKAIAFYLGLKEMVPGPRGRKDVNRIISEEQGHVVTLTQELRNLQKK